VRNVIVLVRAMVEFRAGVPRLRDPSCADKSEWGMLIFLGWAYFAERRLPAGLGAKAPQV
jgi:hypothetical protein